MMLYDCRTVADRDRGIAAAVEAVKSGELAVFPTDTVYGVGADAFTAHAVNALQNARGTDRRVPPVLVGSRHTLDGLVYSLPKAARELADAFWPGALTIVVEHSPSLQWDLGDTGGVVAVRMPLHPVALEVLREVGPMAVTTANKIGQSAPTTAEEARDQLEYAVRVYLEAGPAADPAPSTIVDVTGDEPRVLREGAIPFEKLREVVPGILAVGA
ncbi:threonylcarbamoyl-AMP synthase [Amorphoplanes digitatis]|uniref:L-threonylcarbamoyladenylate synthase n=2 Tax=Actinoplanes digitatis TaxID=1868 RepID=A0A7W7MNB1_9ACTN|nr:tRNA threonylcarbamoyl adenosine modification protein (Sua5/YciO/YrdC/YwlC family) [Actinoplanes digitatis]GID94814.1 threonylcarbamoyl-AMP synthase [Actinoplanes digitatis]